MSEARATQWTVYPTGWDHNNSAGLGAETIFTLTVEWRGGDRFAVCRKDGECLRHDGRKWAYESQPSSRTDRFKSAYRMSAHDALELAKKHVDQITFKGETWADKWKDEWR